MMRNRLPSSPVFFLLMTFLILPIFSNSAKAQDFGGQVQAQAALEEIKRQLIEFSKKFTDNYDLQVSGEGENLKYTRPVKNKDLPRDEPVDRKDPLPAIIRSKQYPKAKDTNNMNVENFNSTLQIGIENFNNVLQMGDPSGIPKLNLENSQSLVLGALQSIFYLVDPDVCARKDSEKISNCISRANVIDQMQDWNLATPYSPGGGIVEDTYQKVRNPDPKTTAENAGMSLDGLLGPLGYQKAGDDKTASLQTTSALRFIRLVTQEVLPLKIQSAVASDKKNDYLAQLRSYASQLSVPLSNYYQMLARRVQTEEDGAYKSQWEREEERVINRMNRKWSDEMDKAAPSIVQREMLSLLAEMNYQLFQMRLEQERMLATESAALTVLIQANVKNVLALSVAPMGTIKTPGQIQPGTTPSTVY